MHISNKKWIWILLSNILFLAGILFTANKIIQKSTDDLVYNDVANIPYNKVGLLLGTSRYLKKGMPNQYFFNRIDAAFELFMANKIKMIVISGDNRKVNYNEPEDMKEELMKRGVPENCIYLDYAGFRTYDSVIRMEKIFGQKSFTVISQEFHNRRAIFIAQRFHLQAIGYNAKEVTAYSGFKTNLREKFARVKVFIDFLTGREPHFLGEKINIKD